MRSLILGSIVAGSIAWSGAAMAQQMCDMAVHGSDAAGNSDFAENLPHRSGSATIVYGGAPGQEFVCGVPAYVPQWSDDTGIFNTETSNPGFVEHSHGHP